MGEYPVVSSFESHEPRLCSKSQSHCCGWSATQPRSIEIRTEPNVRFCRWLGAAGSAWRVHPSLPSNLASGPELPRASLSGECIRQQTRTLPFVGSRRARHGPICGRPIHQLDSSLPRFRRSHREWKILREPWRKSGRGRTTRENPGVYPLHPNGMASSMSITGMFWRTG